MAQSRPCFLGRAAAGVTCRYAVPVQRGTPRAGHSAGRSDARTAREQGYEPCPQEPHPPPSIGRHRLTSLRRMDGSVSIYSGDRCQVECPWHWDNYFSVSRMRCSTQWCTAGPGSSRVRRLPCSELVKVPGQQRITSLRHSASKTRVNALMVLRCARETGSGGVAAHLPQ